MERSNLWRLYSLAKAFGQRPSGFLHLESDLAAWQLDEACLVAGIEIENEIQRGDDPFERRAQDGAASGYRSTAGLPRRKGKIPGLRKKKHAAR
jgi:hypothetical protein